MSKKVAITGATGFIGRHFMRLCLNENWHVRVLSRNLERARRMSDRIEVFPGDLTDNRTDLLSFVSDREVLIHCAGEIGDQSIMRDLHINGCRRLIDAAFGRVPHWLQLSSVGVYGRRHIGTISEDSPQAPMGIYEETKATADALVLEAAITGAFSCTIIRPSAVYGPDMRNESLRSLIHTIRKGLFFFIGPSGAQAIYIHVEDVAAAMLAAIKNPRTHNRIYNVSAQCSIEEFVDTVCKLSNRSLIHKRMPLLVARAVAAIGGNLPGFPLTISRVNALTARTVIDTSRIERDLQFKPRIALAEGLREMVLG